MDPRKRPFSNQNMALCSAMPNLKLQGNLPHCMGTEGHAHQQGRKGPQSQTTGKACRHLPQATSSQSIAAESTCLWTRKRDETERKKKEEGPGQASSQLKEVTPIQLQAVEKRKTAHIHT